MSAAAPIETQPRRLPVITSSSARTARRCLREYELRYERELVPASHIREDVLAPTFGTLVHVGLEAWWDAARSVPEDLDAWGTAAWEAMRAAFAQRSGDGAHLDEFDLVRAEELLLGYHARWADDTSSRYDVLAVEAEFREPLVNPLTGARSRTFERAGKLDALVRERSNDPLRSGRRLIVEHKTTSGQIEPGEVYWQKLTLDSQVSTYLQSHREIGGVLYDVLGKPKLEPLKATPVEARKYTLEKIDKKTGEVTEPSRLYAGQRDRDETVDEWRLRLRGHLHEDLDRYFRRGTVVRLPEELAEAAYDDWQTARAIRDAELAGIWPRNTDACQRFNRLCGYFPICSRTGDADDPLQFRHERPHRELSETTVSTHPIEESASS